MEKKQIYAIYLKYKDRLVTVIPMTIFQDDYDKEKYIAYSKSNSPSFFTDKKQVETLVDYLNKNNKRGTMDYCDTEYIYFSFPCDTIDLLSTLK
jgi:hypothetical protein